MAGEFFDRLPRKLTQPEELLRGHLLDAARLAAQVLPPGKVVSLQEWVECRMPGEVELGTDDGGLVVLRPPQKEPDAALQSFLGRLPTDAFLREEEDLREAIVAALQGGPETLAQVKRLPGVLRCTKVFLPAAIHLEDWIERRIGGEVAVEADERGQRMCRLMSHPPSGPAGRQDTRNREKNDDFFKTLPKDAFLPEEEKLRMAVFDFLAAWSRQELATLRDCQQCPTVSEAKRQLFKGHTVGFKEWVERRIGGELQLKPDSRGDFEINLMPQARPVVAERVALLQQMRRPAPPMGAWSRPPGPPPGQPRPPPPERRKERPPKPEDHFPPPPKGKQFYEERQPGKQFFDELPSDELLDAELELREILLDQIEQYFKKNPSGEGPQLSTIFQGKAKEIKTKLLKNSVSAKEWIDRRIGGEVATKMGKNGNIVIYLRAEGEEEADELMDPDVLDARAQAFFDQLPPDGFLETEETLREVVLNYLERWSDSKPPSLRAAERTPEVAEAMSACLSGAPSVTLKMWIDRRIGGEIATWRKGREVVLGLRAEHGEEADAANMEPEVSGTKKRKAEGESHGSPRFGKGKGR